MARAILLVPVLAWALAGACGGRGTPPLAEPAPAVADAGEPALDAGPVLADGPPIAEAHARSALARRFRAAGYRIREDVAVAGVTLDGCDPQRQVGYEYIAVGERGLDLTAETRAALAAAQGWRVLIVEATDLADLSAQAEAFLAGLREQPAPTRSASDR